ncbi:hypothetical protein BT96DRAFT_84780 [Gymnopus androsaceus JB14]|uniref:Uncharacterized protein n=1 Tax=Gymnopus androsaceus JB14 TaxID=1447944 RepID=A0A6A4IB63_9AGAR|nr:hypothetical protein BT96DRAFT_84780 [Gymnopus androsaceus JB14]
MELEEGEERDTDTQASNLGLGLYRISSPSPFTDPHIQSNLDVNVDQRNGRDWDRESTGHDHDQGRHQSHRDRQSSPDTSRLKRKRDPEAQRSADDDKDGIDGIDEDSAGRPNKLAKVHTRTHPQHHSHHHRSHSHPHGPPSYSHSQNQTHRNGNGHKNDVALQRPHFPRAATSSSLSTRSPSPPPHSHSRSRSSVSSSTTPPHGSGSISGSISGPNPTSTSGPPRTSRTPPFRTSKTPQSSLPMSISPVSPVHTFSSNYNSNNHDNNSSNVAANLTPSTSANPTSNSNSDANPNSSGTSSLTTATTHDPMEPKNRNPKPSWSHPVPSSAHPHSRSHTHPQAQVVNGWNHVASEPASALQRQSQVQSHSQQFQSQPQPTQVAGWYPRYHMTSNPSHASGGADSGGDASGIAGILIPPHHPSHSFSPTSTTVNSTAPAPAPKRWATGTASTSTSASNNVAGVAEGAAGGAGAGSAGSGNGTTGTVKQLSFKHLDLLYDTVGGEYVCRECRQVNSAKKKKPVSFPTTAPSFTALFAHYGEEHKEREEEVLRYGPVKLQEQQVSETVGLYLLIRSNFPPLMFLFVFWDPFFICTSFVIDCYCCFFRFLTHSLPLSSSIYFLSLLVTPHIYI